MRHKLLIKLASGVLFLMMSYSSIAQITKSESVIKFDDTRKVSWPSEFEVVDIQSSADSKTQKAYFYATTASSPQPLIVSLHTWSGDYRQTDELVPLVKQRNLNYIHPNFRGANKNSDACCSKLALSDIDDAIAFAVQHGNVDTTKIYVMGVSGGGFATLSTFMTSLKQVRKFSAWASITDLEAWYKESAAKKSKYALDVLACTNSKDSTLNVQDARQRSPMYMKTPVKKLKSCNLSIYVGIRDGIKGSVPITHSINFYNKLLADLSVSNKSIYVSQQEIAQLLKDRQPLGEFGTIGDRKICLKKQYGNLSLTVFDGVHEMLTEYALNEILKD